MKIILLLFFMGQLFFSYADTTRVELIDPIYPKNIEVRNNRIYITDYPYILIYQREPFKFLKKFGREGNGPGEFFIDQESSDRRERGLQIHLTDKSLLVKTFTLLIQFSLDGILQKTLKHNSAAFTSKFIPVGSQYITSLAHRRKDISNMTICKYNFSSSRAKFFFAAPIWDRKADKTFDFFSRAAHTLLFEVYKDKTYIVKGGDPNLEILIFDQNGEALKSIKLTSDKIKIPQIFIDEVHHYFKIKFKRGLESNLKMTRFPEYFPPVHDFRINNDKIYIFTHNRERQKNELLILDLKGNLIQKLMVPMALRNPEHFHAFCISNNQIYQIIEDIKSEKWFLNRDKTSS